MIHADKLPIIINDYISESDCAVNRVEKTKIIVSSSIFMLINNRLMMSGYEMKKLAPDYFKSTIKITFTIEGKYFYLVFSFNENTEQVEFKFYQYELHIISDSAADGAFATYKLFRFDPTKSTLEIHKEMLVI